ncbi:MAG: SCO family protein [Sphingobium sp.]
MNGKHVVPLLAALLALSGCSSGQEDASDQGQPTKAEIDLTGARIGGPFTLIDQDGKPRSWDDFAGKYRIVYFGYTYCPDVCPVDLQRIAQGYSLFEKEAPERAAKVQPIFISVDPERDTPAVIKNYVSAFHPKLIGLTGTPDQIAAVAKAFAVVYSKETTEGASEYLVGHTRTPYLFDPQGKPLAMLPVDDPATDEQEGLPKDIAAALDRLVQ